MFKDRTLIKQKDAVITILTYFAKHKRGSASVIGSWCGMRIQKAKSLCRVMAQYNLLYEVEKVNIFSKKPYKVYTCNKPLAEIFMQTP